MAVAHSIFWSDEAKAAYAAGIMDGEGYIAIRLHKSGRFFRVIVSVTQVLKGIPVLDFLSQNYGSPICWNQKNPESPKYQPSKKVCWYGEKSRHFLEAIYPYLLFKQRQAALAIRLKQEINTSLRSNPWGTWTPALFEFGRKCHVATAELNWRGVERRSKPRHEEFVNAQMQILAETCSFVKYPSAAQVLGSKGGLRGGPARARNLSPERRQEIARRAAVARWAKSNNIHNGCLPFSDPL